MLGVARSPGGLAALFAEKLRFSVSPVNHFCGFAAGGRAASYKLRKPAKQSFAANRWADPRKPRTLSSFMPNRRRPSESMREPRIGELRISTGPTALLRAWRILPPDRLPEIFDPAKTLSADERKPLPDEQTLAVREKGFFRLR